MATDGEQMARRFEAAVALCHPEIELSSVREHEQALRDLGLAAG